MNRSTSVRPGNERSETGGRFLRGTRVPPVHDPAAGNGAGVAAGVKAEPKVETDREARVASGWLPGGKLARDDSSAECYALASANGQPLPVEIRDGIVVVSGSLTFRADAQWKGTLTVLTNGPPIELSTCGRYVHHGDVLLLESDGHRDGHLYWFSETDHLETMTALGNRLEYVAAPTPVGRQ